MRNASHLQSGIMEMDFRSNMGRGNLRDYHSRTGSSNVDHPRKYEARIFSVKFIEIWGFELFVAFLLG